MNEAFAAEMTELAKRAVVCKGWRWLAGMLVRAGAGILRIDGMDEDGEPVRYERRGGSALCECYVGFPSEQVLPDLTDPATLGCLLALVREARNDPMLYAHPYGQGWRWRSNYRDCTAIYGSEAAALVAALEAAQDRLTSISCS